MTPQTQEIDHKYTNEIVCPWCGYTYRDSWEFNLDDGESEVKDCGACEKTFEATRLITINYCTERAGDAE